MNQILYSPHPPLAYSRMNEEGYPFGVGAELRDPERLAWWNLYWLSDPNVDYFLCNEEDWQKGYGISYEVFIAAATTVSQQKLGQVPIKKLLMTLTPIQFVERLKATKHNHLRIAKSVGPGWLDQVVARANLYRGVLAVQGRVVFASFGKKAYDRKILGKPEGSATIKTLSPATERAPAS